MKKKRGFANNLTPEGRSLGGRVSAQKRRAAALAKLAGMSPMDIARAYYMRGWHQGVRTERRRWLRGREAA